MRVVPILAPLAAFGKLPVMVLGLPTVSFLILV